MNKWYAGYDAAKNTWQIFTDDSLVTIGTLDYDALSQSFDSKEELLDIFPDAIE